MYFVIITKYLLIHAKFICETYITLGFIFVSKILIYLQNFINNFYIFFIYCIFRLLTKNSSLLSMTLE